MISVRRAGLVVAVLAVVMAACGEPCVDLAKRTCDRLGQQEPLCEELREIAARPVAGDDQACSASVEFARGLRRGR